MGERRYFCGGLALFLAVALACKSGSKGSATTGGPETEPSSSAAPAASSTVGPNGPRPDVFIEAKELLGEYKANEVRADAKFKGKRLGVVGFVGDIKKDITDSIYVTIMQPECMTKPFPDPRVCPFERVQAFFGDEHAGDAAALNKGQPIAVNCICDGLMMNVLLRECTVIHLPPPAASLSATAVSPPSKKRRP